MSHSNRSTTGSVGQIPALTAALILLGLAFPATAQNFTRSGDVIDSLWSQPAIIGIRLRKSHNDIELVLDRATKFGNQRTVSVSHAQHESVIPKSVPLVVKHANAAFSGVAQKTVAAVISGSGFTAMAQNSSPNLGTFVGLPPPSKLKGPLRVLPDGSIVAVPESSRSPPHLSDQGSLPPPPVVPPEITAKPSLPVVKSSGRRTVRSVESATRSAHAIPPHTANIDNAPAWQASHSYTIGNEVETIGGMGIAGTRGYKETVANCVSALSSTGPSGTGTDIVDGTCHWKYLCDIDYTSISLWLQNGIPAVTVPPVWQQNTAYNKYDFVYTLQGGAYYLYYANSSGTSCATGSGPTGSTNPVNDCGGVGGLNWTYTGQSYNPSTGQPALTATYAPMRGTYIGYVYNGAEYLNDGMTLTNPSWPGYGKPLIEINDHNQPINCGAECAAINLSLPSIAASRIILTAAPGESIFDNSSNPLVYDASKGVAIRCSTVYNGLASTCLSISDWNVFVNRIQIKSPYNGITFWSAGGLSNDLVDADGDGVSLDDNITFDNSVVYAGNVGVGIKYKDVLLNDTILGKTGAVTGIDQTYHPSFNGAPVLSNTAIMGFTYCAVYQSIDSDTPGFERAAPPSDYNATDVGSGGIQNGTTGITWTTNNVNMTGPGTSMPCPGAHTLYDVPFTTATFANTTSGSYDARLASGSALIGSGGVTVNEVMQFRTTNSAFPDSNVIVPNGNCADPTPSPYASNNVVEPCGSPLMSVTATGIPGGSDVIILGGGVGQGYATITGGGCTSCASPITATLSYAPVQANDIFGTARLSRIDVGAMQSLSRGGGGRLLFR